MGRKATIKRTVDGQEFLGVVEDIEVGKTSRERLYRIKYTDGDLEHLTEQQVREMQIHEKAAADAEEHDEADEEEEVAAMPKRPAGNDRRSGKAKARVRVAKEIARKPVAKAKAARRKPA